MKTSIFLGKTKYSAGGHINISYYGYNDQIALFTTSSSGAELKMTVCLDERPRDGCVWIKTWSENEGVLDAMEKTECFLLTGRKQKTGFVEAVEAEICGDLLSVLKNKNPLDIST